MNKFLNLNQKKFKIIILAALGGMLEFYDFVIYIFFAPLLAGSFFPKTDKISSLLEVYAVFAIGYFVRPLGGLVLSHYGDQYGRKKTFLFSVVLMSVAAGLIGLLPTVKDIGLIATWMFFILRLLQGFSIGGEIPGAIVYICEQVEQNRGFACGIIFGFFNFGILLASLIHFLLNTFLSFEQLSLWGWRVPFIVGGLLGIFSFYLRKNLVESPLFLASQNNKTGITPLLKIIKHYWPMLIQGILLTWLGAVIINLLFLYFPTYLTSFLSYSSSQVSFLNSINLLFYAALLILMSWISDYIGRKWILLMGAFCFALFSRSLFIGLLDHTTVHLILFMFLISLFSSWATIYPSVLVELFPTSLRYTGVAITYNVGFAIFGSLTPFLATYLIKHTGNLFAPSYYLSVSAAICMVSLFFLKDKSGCRLV